MPQVRHNERGEPDNQPPPHQLPAEPKKHLGARAQPLAGDRGDHGVERAPEALLPHDEERRRDHPAAKASYLSVFDRSMEADQPGQYREKKNAAISDALAGKEASRHQQATDDEKLNLACRPVELLAPEQPNRAKRSRNCHSGQRRHQRSRDQDAPRASGQSFRKPR